MWNCYWSLLFIFNYQFQLGWSMVCNRTGTLGDWWCTSSQPAAQGVPSLVAADSCICAANKAMNQQDAYNYCSSLGGFLTDIQNAQENAFVGTFLEALSTSPELNVTASKACPTNGMMFEGYCYVYIKTKKSWADAEAYCKKTYGAHLTSIRSVAQQDFMFYNLSKSCDGCTIYGFWVGGNNYGNPTNWQWSDGTPMNISSLRLTQYKGWDPQPEDPVHQQCIIVVRPDGGWGDWKCPYEAPFVCSWPNSNSIYPAWISLQKAISGYHWNLGKNCPVYTTPYQTINATPDKSAVVFTSTQTWEPVSPTYTANMAVCRFDRNICGRGMCTGACSICTPTVNNTCYMCS